MKTVKELSEQVNISKTSIYNLIKKHNIPLFKKDGKTYIDENGVSLILAHYSVEQQETIKDIIEGETIQAEFQDGFQAEKGHLISLLESQLSEKDKTIQALIQSNQSLIQAVTNQQKLQATQYLTDKNLESTAADTFLTPDKPKKSFFEKFFKKEK